MPKDTFQIVFAEAMRNQGIWRGYLIAGVDNDKARKVIEELMHVFGVPFRAGTDPYDALRADKRLCIVKRA